MDCHNIGLQNTNHHDVALDPASAALTLGLTTCQMSAKCCCHRRAVHKTTLRKLASSAVAPALPQDNVCALQFSHNQGLTVHQAAQDSRKCLTSAASALLRHKMAAQASGLAT